MKKALIILAVALVAITGVGSAAAGNSGSKTDNPTGCKFSVSIDDAARGSIIMTARYWACINPKVAHRVQVYAFQHGRDHGPELFDLDRFSPIRSSELTVDKFFDSRSSRFECDPGSTITVDALMQTVSKTGKVSYSEIVTRKGICTVMGPNNSGSW